MTRLRWMAPALLLALSAVVGCQDRGAKAPGASADQAGKQGDLAQLAPEDRQLAEAQKVCPITGEALGEMGAPVKVTVKGQTVFLCCDGCMKKALDNPDKTLAAVQSQKTGK